MSIQSQINRIKSNLAAAYTAAQSKGASMPSSQNSANLAATISSITAGTGIVTFKGTWNESNNSITFDNIPSSSTPYSEIRAALNAGNTPQLCVTNTAGDWEAYFHLARDGGDYEGFEFTAYEVPGTQSNPLSRFGTVFVTAGDARYYYEEHKETIIFSAKYNYTTEVFSGLPSDIYDKIYSAYQNGRNIVMEINFPNGSKNVLPLTTYCAAGDGSYFSFSASIGSVEMNGSVVDTAGMSIAMCTIYGGSTPSANYYERSIFDV